MEIGVRARIAVDPSRLSQTSRGLVAGPIWVATTDPGAAFPEVEWSDLPVILLATWIPAFRRLASGGGAAECHFMDGPYHFTVSAIDSETWRVACFETREAPSVTNAVAEWTTEAEALIESAVLAGREMLGYCDTRGWWNADTDRLREALAFTDPDRAS